jgi:predicted PurR-regulated permease PerM
MPDLPRPMTDAPARKPASPGGALPPFAIPIPTRASAGWFIAFLAFIVFLRWAQGALIPITLAVLVSYALAPVVELLHVRARLPKAIGAAVTLVAVLGVAGTGLAILQTDALDLLAVVPRAAQKFSVAMRSDRHAPAGTFAVLEKAIGDIERVANSNATAVAPRIAAPGFRVRDYLLVGTLGLIDGALQVVVVISLVYFLLTAGDTFRRILIQVSGTSLSSRKVTIRMLDEINHQIQRYLLVQLASGVLFGVLSWGIFAGMGLERAATWGCIGAVLYFIPYAGPAVLLCAVALVGYVQFDPAAPLVTILASLIACHAFIGMVFVPLLTQRMGRLNAVSVFVALLVWGWLWGIWGLLMGVPIVMALNTVCEHVPELHVVSAFLGRSARALRRG